MLIKNTDLLGYQYTDVDLVDMRIHDLNIECNVGDIPDIEELPVPPEEEVELMGPKQVRLVKMMRLKLN